jgi:hypothetical protein
LKRLFHGGTSEEINYRFWIRDHCDLGDCQRGRGMDDIRSVRCSDRASVQVQSNSDSKGDVSPFKTNVSSSEAQFNSDRHNVLQFNLPEFTIDYLREVPRTRRSLGSSVYQPSVEHRASVLERFALNSHPRTENDFSNKPPTR